MVNEEAKKSPSRARADRVRGDRVPPGFLWQQPYRHRHHHRHRPRSEKPLDPNHPNNHDSTGTEEHEVKRAVLAFQDLDKQRETFDISVKHGVLVAKLDRVIRDRTKYVIRDDEQISFYRDGTRLSPWSGLGEGSRTVWYRVFSGVEDNTIKVTQSEDGEEWSLDQAFRDELEGDIVAGKTFGQLRAKVAAKLGIDDANRVILAATGGVRSGFIPGNAWEARQYQKYLCTEINVRICPDQRYFVFRAFDRDYVFHPEHPRTHHTEVLYIKNAIVSVLTHVKTERMILNHDMPLSASHIRVIYGTRVKKNASRIPWGSTIRFTVPGEIASLFEAAETWLLPATEMCDVCGDEKRVTEMPKQTITAACEHKPRICKDCLQQWIQSSLETSEWDRLKCPECPKFLKFEDVRRHASREIFTRYDTLSTRAALKDIPNFRWCLAAGCDSGQIHNDVCPKFKCHACRHRHCINHNVLWHSGETCEDYDRRNKQKAKDEKASEKAIKETAKKCPKCNKDVYKYTGCNHITCVCRHEWCYICFAPFQRNNHGFLYCRHKPGCTETDPFLEFVEGPQGINPRIPRVGVQWRRPVFPPPRPPPNFHARMARPEAGVPEENENNNNNNIGNRAWPPPAPVPPPRFTAMPRRVQEELDNINRFLQDAGARWPPAQPPQRPTDGVDNQPRPMFAPNDRRQVPMHPIFQDLATRWLNETNDDL